MEMGFIVACLEAGDEVEVAEIFDTSLAEIEEQVRGIREFFDEG